MEKKREAHAVNENKEHLLKSYQLILINSALGDTLGMPVEGWTREQIQKHTGGITEPIEPFFIRDHLGGVVKSDEFGKLPYIAANAGLKKGDWTDDTLLAAATARAIIKTGGLDIDALARESIMLYQATQQMHNANSSYNVFGQTTQNAFENLAKGISPEKSGVVGNVKSPGNGPALKMAPVGIYMHAPGKYEEGLKFAEAASRMTHIDPRSIASGIVQAHAIYALLKGFDRETFLTSLVDTCRAWEKSEEKNVTLSKRLQWVLDNKDVDEKKAYEELGPGWAVTRNYPFALWMFQKHWDNPVEGLLRLVNYGGDCDSTAAIYGALIGARGIRLPQSWVYDLNGAEELVVLAKNIASLH